MLRAPSVIHLDIQRYLDNYPDATEDEDLVDNLNVLFYQNKICSLPEDTGCTIEDMLQNGWGRFDLLESHHSYIQWLFPIRERGMNWYAQPLQRHEMEVMCGDSECRARLLRAYRMMLNFYGMELVSVESGRVCAQVQQNDPLQARAASSAQRRDTVVHIPAWIDRYANLNTSSHNYLRITRILKSLGELGMEHLKLGLLMHVYTDVCLGRLGNAVKRAYSVYWKHTLRCPDDVTRLKTFHTWCLSVTHRRTESDAGNQVEAVLRERARARELIACV